MNAFEKNKIQRFEDQPIRTAWDEESEEWFFSVVDVVGVLTEQSDHDRARNYWKVLKKRLAGEGNQSVTNCNRLKMRSPKDGKRYDTDVATTELTKTQDPHGLEENRAVAKTGGKIAGDARKSIEKETGKSVITSDNAAKLNEAVAGMIKSVTDENK